MKSESLKCPFCGYFPPMLLASQNEQYENVYGRVCSNCKEYIPPNKQILEVEKNKIIKDNLKQKCLERLRKTLEKKYGNQF